MNKSPYVVHVNSDNTHTYFIFDELSAANAYAHKCAQDLHVKQQWDFAFTGEIPADGHYFWSCGDYTVSVEQATPARLV